MTGPTTFFSSDLAEVEINLAECTLKTTRLIANRTYAYDFNMIGHPLSKTVCEYLADHGPNLPSSTLVSYCYGFLHLLSFFRDAGYQGLNAESYAKFIEWLKTILSQQRSAPLTESTRRVFSNLVLNFMEWLVYRGLINEKELDVARVRHRKAWRGFSARQLERMRLKAVSPEDYIRLIRAARLEYEECKQIMEQSDTKQDQYDVTFPLLPFSILLGIELAVRSVEFNYLKVRDLRGDRLFLNPPNKPASEVWLPPSLMASLALAQSWMSRYRANPNPDDPLLVCPLENGPRSNQLVRFDTILLSSSLSRFYRKYFDLIAPDGMPYLCATGHEDEPDLIPFSLSFSDFRSAAITEAARQERNPTVVMRFARHRCFATTLKYYIRETHRQWLSNVATFLAPSAELVRISLENKIASPEEEAKAEASDAVVPGGHCEPALSGDHSCIRASDCRLCPFFRIHVSKRDFFVKEMEDTLEQAERLQTEQGLIRDAQNLREFAALNQAIVNRIDEHLSGR